MTVVPELSTDDSASSANRTTLPSEVLEKDKSAPKKPLLAAGGGTTKTGELRCIATGADT
jgi:hypothetical protein